jgi:hypothetical protein
MENPMEDMMRIPEGDTPEAPKKPTRVAKALEELHEGVVDTIETAEEKTA